MAAAVVVTAASAQAYPVGVAAGGFGGEGEDEGDEAQGDGGEEGVLQGQHAPHLRGEQPAERQRGHAEVGGGRRGIQLQSTAAPIRMATPVSSISSIHASADARPRNVT